MCSSERYALSTSPSHAPHEKDIPYSTATPSLSCKFADIDNSTQFLPTTFAWFVQLHLIFPFKSFDKGFIPLQVLLMLLWRSSSPPRSFWVAVLLMQSTQLGVTGEGRVTLRFLTTSIVFIIIGVVVQLTFDIIRSPFCNKINSQSLENAPCQCWCPCRPPFYLRGIYVTLKIWYMF